MSALREKEGIDVTPEEIEEELNSMVREATRETESLKQILDTENGRASINSILINRKVLNLLTSITKGETIVASSSRTETLSEEDKGESEEGAENA
jgi:FKBP-type peptidyl-prolyl cis-trans isomerase (trigger factor)